TFDSVGLTAKKLAGFVKCSSELLEDSVAGLAEFISQEAAYQIGKLEDNCCFNGDGTSTCGGIRGINQTILRLAEGSQPVPGTISLPLSTMRTLRTSGGCSCCRFAKREMVHLAFRFRDRDGASYSREWWPARRLFLSGLPRCADRAEKSR